MQVRRLALLMLAAALITGCHQLNLMSFLDKEKARDKERQDNVRAALRGEAGHSRLIGDYIKIGGAGFTKVQGVGLIDRLEGTGEDPPSSVYTKMLLEDMRRHEIKDPQTFLRSANTAVVIVTAYIPPIARKGEKIDVEITLPDGSETKSLSGGWLMPCHLRERALLDGEVREGREIAVATGPILIDALTPSSDTNLAGHRRGRIPAGATYLGDDRHLAVAVQSEYRSVRMSTQIAERIGSRFYDYDEHGIKRKLAEAKSDAYLELLVHDQYRDNYARYLQVIRNMALRETPVERHIRMEQLTDQIQFGPTAESAALQLEAIGSTAIPTLKQGLASEDLEARFHAAVSLAYLGNADGVPALKEAAAKVPAFRIFALAGLAALKDGSSAEALRDLMNEESTETRYGAFRALSTMAPNDPFVRGEQLNGTFTLHPIPSTSSPLIHVTRFKKAEVVVFGVDQQLMPPVILRAGSSILVQSTAEGDRIKVQRIAPGEAPKERIVSRRIVDVIRAAADLGAQYPDVARLLLEAERQRNLVGKIAVDTLPKPGRTYIRPSSQFASGEVFDSNDSDDESPSGVEGTPVQIGGEGMLPNLFEEHPVESEASPAQSKLPVNTADAVLK